MPGVFRTCRRHMIRYPAGSRCPYCPDPKAWARDHSTRDALRRIVLARQGGQCAFELDGVQCPAAAAELHHVVARVDGGSDDPSNLVGLCKDHHVVLTGVRPQR